MYKIDIEEMATWIDEHEEPLDCDELAEIFDD